MTSTKAIRTAVALLAAPLLTVSCGGGGGGNAMSPTPTPTPTPSGTTITITTTGVSPKQLQVSVGTRVTFINNDTRSHDIESDPHPQHTDCPAINEVGFIQQGQSRQTGSLTVARTCGYHDHNDSENASLKGTIVVQ